MRSYVARCAFGLALLATAPVAQAQALNEGALRVYLENAVSGAQGRVEVSIGEIDPRLRLAPCTRIEPFLPNGARLWGRSTIGVRCVEGATWTTYVPVDVRIYGPALVAARGLNAGRPLEPADVRVEEIELTREPPGVLSDPSQIRHKTLARTLRAGETLRGNQLRARPVVATGEMVKLTYSGSGFTISAKGRALSPAVAGQSVRVQTASGKILTGTARPGKIVEVQS